MQPHDHSEGRPRAAKSEAVRETMTMGEAASLLGVSVRTVRQMCKAFEEDRARGVPEDKAAGLPFAWTSLGMNRQDRNGHRLKGHRRPFADAVRFLAKQSGRLDSRA